MIKFIILNSLCLIGVTQTLIYQSIQKTSDYFQNNANLPYSTEEFKLCNEIESMEEYVRNNLKSCRSDAEQVVENIDLVLIKLNEYDSSHMNIFNNLRRIPMFVEQKRTSRLRDSLTMYELEINEYEENATDEIWDCLDKNIKQVITEDVPKNIYLFSIWCWKVFVNLDTMNPSSF